MFFQILKHSQISNTGWGTVIRTQECRSQSQNILFSKVFYFVLKCLVFSTSQPFLFAISFFIFLNYSKMMDKFWTSKHHPLIMLFTILILHLLYTFSNVFANNFTTILSFQFSSSISSSFTTFILPLLSIWCINITKSIHYGGNFMKVSILYMKK